MDFKMFRLPINRSKLLAKVGLDSHRPKKYLKVKNLK